MSMIFTPKDPTEHYKFYGRIMKQEKEKRMKKSVTAFNSKNEKEEEGNKTWKEGQEVRDNLLASVLCDTSSLSLISVLFCV